MIRLARAYVAGEVHFSEVCTAAGEFRNVVCFFTGNAKIQNMAKEWGTMATRVWPEFAQINDPISEVEFREWVVAQLDVFAPENDPKSILS